MLKGTVSRQVVLEYKTLGKVSHLNESGMLVQRFSNKKYHVFLFNASYGYECYDHYVYDTYYEIPNTFIKRLED